ncbi:hypothetical protein [Neisseria sp.]
MALRPESDLIQPASANPFPHIYPRKRPSENLLSDGLLCDNNVFNH